MEKGDFLLIDLEGKDERGNVFDTTKGERAKRLHGKEGPLLVILGITPVIKGIEGELYRMKEGEEREIIVPPSKGFGLRDKSKILIVPISNFERMPRVGDVVTIETGNSVSMGIVISLNSGRVMIDTNHPLAGKTTFFKIKIVKKISSDIEKAEALIKENVKEFESKEGQIIIRDKLKDDEKEALKKLLDSYNIKVKLVFE